MNTNLSMQTKFFAFIFLLNNRLQFEMKNLLDVGLTTYVHPQLIALV